jgi:hypothetical protein
MTKALGLRGRGRPKGVRNKEKPPAAPLKNSRMLSLMEGCYTAEEWLKRFKKLSPSEQFKLKASVEPKAKEEGAGTTIRMIIRGIKGWICESCGHRQEGKNDGAEGPVDGPLDVPVSDAPPDSMESRLAAEDVERRARTYPRPSPGPSRPAPVLEEEPEELPLPPGTPVFTVPNHLDEHEFRGPKEWRGVLPVPGVDEG